MPRGKSRPKVSVMRRMWIHRRRSRGSSDIDSPSGTLLWPPWAPTRVVEERRVRRRVEVSEGRERRILGGLFLLPLHELSVLTADVSCGVGRSRLLFQCKRTSARAQ